MLDLYKNIKLIREELEMSQDDLAKLTGYTSRSSIAKIEKGEVDLPQSKIALFASALNTTPGALMGLTEADSSSHLIDEIRIGIGNRIKELRLKENLSREALAIKIGVTPSAIANYENAVSAPKAEIMYKLFDTLQCDANYLYQGNTSSYNYNHATPREIEIIKKYRDLDDHGKEIVDIVLDKEHARVTSKVIPLSRPILNAAHERTDIEVTDEMRKHDDNIMMNDKVWE